MIVEVLEIRKVKSNNSYLEFYVGVERFELSTSSSRTKRAKPGCATPRLKTI